jgi:hypothetical protein
MGDKKLTVEQVLAEMPFRGAVYLNPVENRCYKLGDFDPSASGEVEFRGAQMVMPSDFSAIRAQVVLEETIQFARPLYLMRNCCRVYPTMSIKFSIPKGTVAVTARERVPILEEPKISKAEFDKIDFELPKNVVLLVMPRESRYSPGGTEAMRAMVEDAAKALAAAENSQIKTVAESATEISGHDWGDSNNPYVDVAAVMDAVKPHRVDFIAAHPLVWLDFFSNSFVKGTNQPVQTPEGLMGGVFTIPGLPGVKGISEQLLTNTKAIVGSTSAPCISHADGPSESARFANELAGYDAFVIRHWVQPQVNVSDAIRVLTGVHA